MFRIVNICTNEYIKAMIKKCNKDKMKPSRVYRDIDDNTIHLEFKTEKGHIVDIIPYGNSIVKILCEAQLCAYSKIKIKDGAYYMKYYNTNGDKVYEHKIDLCKLV